MPLAAGSHLGPYEILGALGAGGMGEVYRAHDSKLNRAVAIKVLPDLFASDPERIARFTREAQTLAALNHPHIAQVYGLESHSIASRAPGQTTALVMELVDGEDLSALTARGPMPLRDAFPIVRQIADALEVAHEQGIVHRDLKPANVKVRPDGTVKVLDFGLAKALAPDAGVVPANAMNSPTFSVHATQMGVILGTAAYMAPEQARGRPIDRRADIWAFGCVLYEVVTGRRAFDGENVSDVLARVIEREPDFSALPSDMSPEIRHLLARCLAKDPKARLRDIGEARIALDDAIAGKTGQASRQPGATSRVSWRRALPWALAAAFAIVAVVLYLRTTATIPTSPIHVEVSLPPDVEFYGGPSLSADGRTLAFVGVRMGVRQIYVRTLDETNLQPVPGTDSAISVALSSDGRTAAFVTNDTQLKRVSFANGVVEPLVTGAMLFSGPAWVSDGAILYSRGARLMLRSRDGHERELAAVDESAGEMSLSWPVPTADNRTILFVSRRKSAGGVQSRVESVPLAGGPRRLVLDGAEQVVFASADRLVFARNGTLYTASFDMARTATTGTPTRLAEAVVEGSVGGIAAAAAAAGTLLLAPSSVLANHLVSVSMGGGERPIRSEAREFRNPRMSPDGRAIAFSEAGAVWTLDPERGAFTRVSTIRDRTVGFAIWSPDGTRIYYRSADGIRYQSADGEGASTLLPNTVQGDYPNSFTPDGATLVMIRVTAERGGDIYTTPAAGGELKPLVATKSYEGGPQVSPDGKWLTYVSDESGRFEVYLRPVGGPDRKWPVSSEGGVHAIWSRNGREIFYRSGRRVLSVDVTTTPAVRLSAPRLLFENRYVFGQNLTIPNYSLTADGREFIMVEEEPGGRHLNLLLNWWQGSR